MPRELQRRSRKLAASLRALTSALALTLGAAGCGQPAPRTASAPVTVAPTDVYVETSAETNAGNVLHMMVRSVPHNIAATVTESYDEALALLVDRHDPSIVSAQPIFPGTNRTIRLNQPVAESVILYFFFTSPGKIWRVQMNDPVPARVRVTLGLNQVEEVRQ